MTRVRSRPTRRVGNDCCRERGATQAPNPQIDAARLARRHPHLTMSTPFAPGSVSLRLYPHNDLGAVAIVDELRAQAALAEGHGFDGVMTSEHHGGFHGYLPNPLQAAGWCLEAMRTGGRRPPAAAAAATVALVAEEIAWLAARFPGRVGLGVASGALPADFEVMHVPMDDARGALHRRLRGTGRHPRRHRRRPARRRSGDPRPARPPGPGPERGDGLHRRAPRRRASAPACSSTRSRRRNGAASSSTPTARPAGPRPAS